MIIDMHTHVGGDEPLLLKFLKRKDPKEWAKYWIKDYDHFSSLVKTSGKMSDLVIFNVAYALGLFGVPLVNNLLDINKINGSEYIDKIAVLASGPVVKDGKVSVRDTPFYTSNDFVMSLAKKNNRIVPCISINPTADDAIDELERHVEAGARMIKLFPSIQEWHADGLDEDQHEMPYQNKLGIFYEKLKQLQMLVMVHTGIEEVVDPNNQYLKEHGGDISKLELLIKAGANVICAHSGYDLSYWSGKEDMHNQGKEVFEAMGIHKNVYGDPSGALSSEYPYIGSIALDFYGNKLDRMVYGSDLPVGLVDPKKLLKKIPDGEDPKLEFTRQLFQEMLDTPIIMNCKNNFDKHYLITKLVLDKLDITENDQEAYFKRGAKLLRYM